MAVNPDVYVEAYNRVMDKPVSARLWHASQFDIFRSAGSSSGSALSKLAQGGVAVGVAATSLIPIPIVGTLAGEALQAVADARREGQHAKKRDAAKEAKDVETEVKFAIKGKLGPELDRYRRKASEATEAVNAGYEIFKQEETVSCEEVFAMAYLIAQAERRINILREAVEDIAAVCDIAKAWIVELETGKSYGEKKKAEVIGRSRRNAVAPQDGLIFFKNYIRTVVLRRKIRWEALSADSQLSHIGQVKAGKTCPNWCQFTPPAEQSGRDPDLAATRKWVADGVRNLFSPFSINTFVTVTPHTDYQRE